jgi:hypothetical protein
MSFCAAAVFGQQMPQMSPAAMMAAMQLLSGPPPLAYLVSKKPIQQDLELDKAQVQRLQTGQAKFAALALKLMQAKSADEIAAQMQAADKAVTSVLSKDQVARLKEISLRVQGPPGLLAPEVAQKLELTDQQTAKLKGLGSRDGKQVPAILTAEQLEKLRGLLGRSFRAKVDWPPTNLPGMPGVMMPKK